MASSNRRLQAGSRIASGPLSFPWDSRWGVCKVPVVEFKVLGPLQVMREVAAVEPGSPKQRALLIDLLVHHGQVVSRDQLIEDLWAGSPPGTGLGVLQNYVSQLRKAIGPRLLATRGQGYALDIDPEALNSVRFERLVGQARAARAAHPRPRRQVPRTDRGDPQRHRHHHGAHRCSDAPHERDHGTQGQDAPR
jgi:DNA-binding winged helix-turn-helix (wHTH) protein